ncbi:MAG: general secretion pathway protein GspF [Gammaproteobacteria bacterium]|nr:general secretion pathway protein GspF [Gammaproteobacteria bacterium]
MDTRPKTAEQYIELIDQALFEIEDLRAAVEYDEDSMGSAAGFLGQLEADVRGLKQAMLEGRYHFGDSDLPFMKIVERQDERVLPFKYLLRMINATHRMGLNVDPE